MNALMGALRLAIKEIEKLNFGTKDSRVLPVTAQRTCCSRSRGGGVAEGNKFVVVSRFLVRGILFGGHYVFVDQKVKPSG